MTQSKINIEADAGRLLRRLAAYGWHRTIDMDSAGWLIKRGYAYWSGQDLFMTIEGRTYYEGLCLNPAVTESPAKWKEEARSGMKVAAGRMGTVTVQSEIDRACIPKPSGPGTRATPESILDGLQRDMAARVKWAEKLGVSPAELERYGMEGRLRVCCHCNEVGIHDRKGEGRFHSRCRKCRSNNNATNS